MIALVGLLGISLFIVLLARNKSIMPAAFIIVILLIPLCLGIPLKDISQYVADGIASTATLGIMAAFAILFFTLMNKVGVFDTIVGGITSKIGNHIYPVLLATMLVSICSHLDGQAPSTILVTIPALYPFYKKLKIRPVVLTFILSSVVGIWSFLPWGSVTLTNSVVMGVDVLEIWQELLPSLLCMTGVLALALLGTAYTEKKRIAAGLNDGLSYDSMFQSSGEPLPERTKKLLPFNVILTVAVLMLLFLNIVNTAVVFMAGYTIAILVNYRTMKEQMGHFSENSSTALMICLAMILGGVFGNVLNQSGVLNAMITALVSVFPASWSRYLLTIFGALSYPLGCFLGLTAYSFGVTPVINGVAGTFGFSTLQSVCALAPGYSMSLMVCPIMPSTHLMLGVAGISLKEHVRYSFVRLFLLALIFLAITILLGNVPL